MLIKTVLIKIEKYSSFVYSKVYFGVHNLVDCLVIEIHPNVNSKVRCPECKKRCSTYNTSRSSCLFSYVPIWGFPVYFFYKPRRIYCREHGILTKYISWYNGKEWITNTYKIFLGCWAKGLSWAEVADVFKTSWDTVFNSVKGLVEQGFGNPCLWQKNRVLDKIESISIDELQVFNGQNYMTLVYQIDNHCKRLLWCGKDRTSKTLLRFFRFPGKEKTQLIRYICTDIWQPYLCHRHGYPRVIKKKAPWALNILDRFHIMKKFAEGMPTA